MLDLDFVRKNRNSAAPTYDNASVLSREMADRLMERLPFITMQPQRIVECGASTGYLSRHLQQFYPHAELVPIDFSESMLCRHPSGGVVAHCDSLPFQTHSVDMIISNNLLNWVNDLGACFREFQRILKPGGFILLTMLGVMTLKELRTAFASCRAYWHLFPDMHDIGDLLLRSGFQDPVMDMETLSIRYKKITTLFSDIKLTGARNAHPKRFTGLFGKKRWEAAMMVFERIRGCDDAYPISVEMIYGHAVKLLDTPEPGLGEFSFSVDDIFKRC